MSIPVPISVQANRLEKYGINKELKPLFDKKKRECKEMAIKIKKDKLMVGHYKDKYKAGKLELESKEFSLNPREIMRRRAKKKELKATKKLIKKIKLDIKLKKMKYEELITERKNIRGFIKVTYNNNKHLIKDIKDDKRREREEKLRKAGIKIKDTAISIKDKVEKTTTNTKEKFIPKENTEKSDEEQR